LLLLAGKAFNIPTTAKYALWSIAESLRCNVENCALAGAVDWLAKPLGLEACPATEDHLLGRRIRVWAKRELLRQQLGSEGRQRLFLRSAVLDDTQGMFLIDRGQQGV
jgi:hypothetical protein